MGNRLVCLCNFVEEKEILTAIKKGAITVKDVSMVTKAGSTCGKCKPEIESTLKEHIEKKQGGQLFLNFDNLETT